MGLGVGADLGLDALLLLEQHATHLEVADPREHRALHDGSAFIILDVSHPHVLIESDLLRETLLFKITDGVVVGVCQEMHHIARCFDVILEMGHKMRAVTFDLLVRTNGAEDNLGEAAALEGTVCDAADDLEGLLDDGDGQVGTVVDKARDVILGHLGELFLEDALQAGEDDEGLAIVVVVYYTELDFAGALFDDGGLVACC